MTSLAPPAKAQLLINVYPSQDNPNSQSIWVFSGSDAAWYGSSIRSSQNFHIRDSWTLGSVGNLDFYTANKPTNQILTLSPLFSSASNPKDIESIESRLAGSSRVSSPFYSGLTFATSATNAPTITISGTSRSIGSLFMNDVSGRMSLEFEYLLPIWFTPMVLHPVGLAPAF